MEKLTLPTNSSLEVPAGDVGASPTKLKSNYNFMRKIPKDAEASNILIGEMNELDKCFLAFIRLEEASFLGDLTEVPIPTRFLFVLLGPQVCSVLFVVYRRTSLYARDRDRKICLAYKKYVSHITNLNIKRPWMTINKKISPI
jgi:hypothetical protein